MPNAMFGKIFELNQSKYQCFQVQPVTCYDLSVSLYKFEIYSLDPFKMMDDFLEVFSFNMLFLKLNQFICNQRSIMPALGLAQFKSACEKGLVTALNMIFSVELSCSMLIVNHSIMSPTLNVNPKQFVTPCKFFWGIMELKCCNYCHLSRDFASKFQSSMTIFHHKLLTREGRVLAHG